MGKFGIFFPRTPFFKQEIIIYNAIIWSSSLLRQIYRSVTTFKFAIKIMNCDILKRIEKVFNQIGACLF